MKVKELIEQLKKFDPDHDVLCCSDNESLLAPAHLFRLLEITHIGVVEGLKTRGEDGVPSLKIGKAPHSEPHILIDVTSEF